MLTTTQQKKLNRLIQDTIVPALYEDFNFTSKEQVELAIKFIQDDLSSLIPEHYVKDEEEE